eukprot:TRINITY_DN13275_c0_g1_i10.p1 TRINITY_DN13275_c0_g1~~TRINITY_DN13275_c0_g1_i10.p1  ORF type:complete len:596 (+),score=96.33 TRINITY_DN13275_c0_g1_i10:36-1823(+)
MEENVTGGIELKHEEEIELENEEEGDRIEELLLDNLILHIPSSLFANLTIFANFFSLQTLGSLPTDIKERLNSMLPNFPKNDGEQKLQTLHMLFGGQNIAFGNPLYDFREQVLRGRYHPDSVLINKYARNAKKRDKIVVQEEYKFKLMHDVLKSRRDLLESTSGSQVSLPLAVQKLPKQVLTLGCSIKQRSKRRYLEEIQDLKQETEDYEFSSDDEWVLQEVQLHGKLLSLSDDYSNIVREDLQQASVQEPSLAVVQQHQQILQHPHVDPLSIPPPPPPQHGVVPLQLEPAAPHVLEIVNQQQKPQKYLKQETHASYFNLICDLFDCFPERVASLVDLEQAVASWQQSPIAGLNSWYSFSFGQPSWVKLVESALAFLAGQMPDQLPPNFAPFVHQSDGVFQWIDGGAVNQLPFLFDWWWQRRDNFNVSRGDSRVRPSSLQERLEFQRQEAKRYSAPNRAFRWVMADYSVCVGPIKSQGVKLKAHPLLKSNRPPYVTVLSLVRDAVSRLPNGEGSRLDILELLKDSQFLVPDPDLASLSSTLSTALDRLQAESEPCIAFDANKKLWIYCHREKSMEELEAIAQRVFASKPKKFKLK